MTLGRKTKGAKKSSNRRIVESWEEKKNRLEKQKKINQKRLSEETQEEKEFRVQLQRKFQRNYLSGNSKNHTVHSSIQVLPILKYFQKAMPDLQRLWEI